jgi:hypothetical protein
MIRVSAGVASIGGFADSVVLAVVVGISVEVVGTWCRGRDPLLLGRRPRWGQTAGLLSARVDLQHHCLALAILKCILALALNHDGSIHQRLKVGIWDSYHDTLQLIV